MDGVTVAVQEQGGGATDAKFRPSVEAVQEFKVLTNSFSAEYGFTGGAAINLVMRSGTNQVRGSLFEFHRDSALNANNFFANRSGSKPAVFRRNNFGGAVGGPVRLPRAYDGRDRTFFFFHYERTPASSPQTTLITVPTAMEKQGDFSQTLDSQGRLIRIYDPYSVRQVGAGWARDPLPGNVVPAARRNPTAVAAIKYYPEANLPGTPYTHTNNFFFNAAARSSNYETTTKIDHNFSQWQRLTGRFSRSGASSHNVNAWQNPMNPADGGDSADVTHNVSLDYTRVGSPTTIWSLRWGVARQFGTRTPYCGECKFDMAEFRFQQPIPIQLPPRFSPEGYSEVGTAPQALVVRGEDVNHIISNLSKVTGRHSLKIGGEARLFRLNYGQPGVNYVGFSFSRRATMADPFRSDSLQGNGLASMLLGWGSGGTHYVRSRSSTAYQGYGAFIQDDIQVTSRLTLNVGLRYELPVPRTERYNRLSWVDPLAPSPLKVPEFPDLRGGLRFADSKNRRPYDTDKNNWGPRLGFAFRLRPKMVVRAGYGIYYGFTRAQAGSALGQGFSAQTDWTPSLDGGVTQYANLSNPFPTGLNAPVGSSLGLLSYVGLSVSGPIRTWDTSPYYQQWSLSVQRELPANAVAEIAYSGSRGVHLGFGGLTSLNYLDPKYHSLGAGLSTLVQNPFYGVIVDPVSTLSRPTASRAQLLRPHPQFTGFAGMPAPPIANSVYHAVQIKFTKRYSNGLAVTLHYTFSKLIDDTSLSATGMEWLSGYNGDAPIQTYWNLRLERSVSLYDVPHRMGLDFSYELPVGRGRAAGGTWPKWLDYLAGGWQVNGIVTLASGRPVIPRLSGGILPDATQRPNLLFDPSLSGPVSQRLDRFLNPDAFSRPEPYTPGNAPRTLCSVRSGGPRNADVSLFKNIYFTEGRERYLQIRGEAFNVTNTPVFSWPNATVGSTSFGVISSQYNSPRQLQLAMKLYF